MPNKPAANTVTVSFTLPRELGRVLEAQARRQMTNKSDIIRRALLAYIPKEEADRIVSSMLEERADADPAPAKPVKYPKPKRGQKAS